MSKLSPPQQALRALANPAKAKVLQGFFKTGAGEYGEGDVFLGVTVPQTRKVARQFSECSIEDIEWLMKSAVHEDRLLGLLLLVQRFRSETDASARGVLFDLYLSFVKKGYVNNWDLVDTSAAQLVGVSLFKKPDDLLDVLARSALLWERRVAMVATFYGIQQGSSKTALRIAKILLQDKHDLIQKAVGWMLREVGKRCSVQELEEFLVKYYKQMPRTMLRYAIERLPEARRKAYLQGLL